MQNTQEKIEHGLMDLIRRRIAEAGSISISEYMALALAHPEFGYYMRRDPLGEAGDFITAPEISQIFGELVGLWLSEQWRLMEKPEVALVELGPGRGTLMADLLRATSRIAGFHDAISIHLVEISPALRGKQQQTLAGKHPRIAWHEDLADIPEKPLLLVANEFFDALPIQQFVRTHKGWQERKVGDGKGGQLSLVQQPGTPPESIAGAMFIDDEICEYSEAAVTVGKTIGEHLALHGGVTLIVDYGYERGTSGDTWQAVRNHRYHDPLRFPGEADLTAHVDFNALKEAAKSAGAFAYGPAPQGVFLGMLGAQTRAETLCDGADDVEANSVLTGLERLTSPDQMGTLFKVLCLVSPGHPKPEGF